MQNEKFNNVIVILFIVFLTGLIFFNLITANQLYPIAGWDSCSFAPTAINLKNEGKLINQYYPRSFDVDVKKQGRFLYYTPLYPITLSLLMYNGTPHAAYIAQWILISCILISIAITLFMLIRNFYKINKKLFTFYVILVFLAIISFMTFFNNNLFRPEILVSLLLLISILTYEYFNRINAIFHGAILGLICLTHPVSSMIWFCVLASIISIENKHHETMKRILILITSALVVSLLVLLFQPYTISELINGLIYHSKISVFERHEFSISELMNSNLFVSDRTFYLLVFITFLLSNIYLIRKYKLKIRAKGIFYLFNILFYILIIYFGFRIPATNYNIYVFYPLYLVVIFFTILNLFYYFRKKVVYVLSFGFLIFFLASFGFIRTSLLYFSYINSSYTYNHTLNYLKTKNIFTNNKKVGGTHSFWVFNTNYNNYRLYQQGVDFDYIITQQAITGAIIPPKIKDYILIKSTYSNYPIKLLNIKISDNPQFYQFALYQRIK